MSGIGLFTVLIVVASGEAKNFFVDKKFTIKPVVGGFILGLFLFAFEAWNQELATRFDVLIIIAAFLVNGTKVIDEIEKVKKNG